MAVYVDDYRVRWHGYKMSHLFTVPFDEDALHQFAQRLGLKREWYQREHYDLSDSKRQLAIEYGAVAVTAKQGVLLRLNDNYSRRKETHMPRGGKGTQKGKRTAGRERVVGPTKPVNRKDAQMLHPVVTVIVDGGATLEVKGHFARKLIKTVDNMFGVEMVHPKEAYKVSVTPVDLGQVDLFKALDATEKSLDKALGHTAPKGRQPATAKDGAGAATLQ